MSKLNNIIKKVQKEYFNRENLINKYNLRKKCKCGASITFYYKQEYKCCRYCGHYVYRDSKTEFKYKLSNLIHK